MPPIDPTDTIGGILIRHGGRALTIQPNLERFAAGRFPNTMRMDVGWVLPYGK
jgi:hypothetical protein